MKMNMNILGAVAISVLAMATSVSAATIKVNWSASIVDNDGVAGVANGDTITGMFTYNDTVPDSGTGSFGVYETNHVSSFTLNGLSGSTSGNSIFVFNNINPEGDQFDTRGGGSYIGDLIDGSTFNLIFVRFTDSTRSVFSDTSLPSSLDPLDFDFLFTSRLGLSSGRNISFRVDTFSTAAVPLPASLPLLAAGLFGLGYAARRKRKQAI